MRQITVDKADLKVRLQTNRASHHSTYLKAVEVYRKKAAELAKEQAELLLRGEIRVIVVNLPVPEDHTDDYDRALQMLDWDKGSVTILTEDEFRQYVQDDWGWQRSFATNTTSYLAT